MIDDRFASHPARDLFQHVRNEYPCAAKSRLTVTDLRISHDVTANQMSFARFFHSNFLPLRRWSHRLYSRQAMRRDRAGRRNFRLIFPTDSFLTSTLRKVLVAEPGSLWRADAAHAINAAQV